MAVLQYIFTHKQYIEQTNNNITTHITTNLEECGQCPVIASFTLAVSSQLRKKQGKTSVRVRKTSGRVQYTHYRNTHTLQNLHTYTQSHTHTHSPTPHTLTPTHTHTHTRARAHTHTPTHTHYKAHTLQNNLWSAPSSTYIQFIF